MVHRAPAVQHDGEGGEGDDEGHVVPCEDDGEEAGGGAEGGHPHRHLPPPQPGEPPLGRWWGPPTWATRVSRALL